MRGACTLTEHHVEFDMSSFASAQFNSAHGERARHGGFACPGTLGKGTKNCDVLICVALPKLSSFVCVPRDLP